MGNQKTQLKMLMVAIVVGVFIFSILPTIVSAEGVDDGTIKIGEINTFTVKPAQPSFFDKLISSFFRISTDKANYYVGDVIGITEQLNLQEQCSQLAVIARLYPGSTASGSSIKSASYIVGSASYSCIEAPMTINTAGLAAGTYTIQTIWECDSTLVYNDGTCSGTSESTRISTYTFTLANQGTSLPAETACKIRNCNAGETLKNPTSSSCYCAPTYTIGDGKCSSGEPTYSSDCKVTSCPTSQLLVDGKCVYKYLICSTQGGTKDCSTPTNNNAGTGDTGTGDTGTGTTSNVNDPEIKAEIYSIRLGSSAGDEIQKNSEGAYVVSPGQNVRVNFKVRTTYGDFKARLSLVNPTKQIIPGVPVVLAQSDTFLVEAGAIPANVAVDWGLNKPEGLFSIFSDVSSTETQCCQGQSNMAAKYIRVEKAFSLYRGVTSLGSYLWSDGLPSGTRDTDIIEFEETYELNIPDSSTVDKCPVGGISTKYWNANSTDYILYVLAKNDCAFKEGLATGYNHGSFATVPLKVTGEGISDSTSGDKCSDNFECDSGVCAPSTNFFERIGGVKRCAEGAGAGGDSLINFKKVSLTKDKITTATTTELLASACKESKECIAPENHTASCVSISNLRKDGVITKSTSDSFFNTAKTVTGGTALGAGLGITGCIVTAALTAGGTAATGGAAAVIGTPVVLTACGLAGGLIGGTATATVVSLADDDELVKALRAGDDSQVGICTAEPESAFDIQGWINKAGSLIKITGNKQTDGLIVIGAGIFVVYLFLSLLVGGKKQ